jgi:hypothetical protein
MDNQRRARWVYTSYALAKVEPYMVLLAQQLGRLDAKLILEDNRYSHLLPAQRESTQECLQLDERLALSYLWVLGSFELLRTLLERIGNGTTQFDASVTKKVEAVKKKIAQLRSPLAKLKNTSGEATIPYPSLHEQLGISWRISETTYISRRELSESFLDLLEYMYNGDDIDHRNSSAGS